MSPSAAGFATFDALQASVEGPPLEQLVGRKAASLITLRQWGLPVPPGACLTVAAFRRFLEHNDLTAAAADAATERAAGALVEAIQRAALPGDLQATVGAFLAAHPGTRFAVRSSGTAEDSPGFSFAGLYTTELNVAGESAVVDAIKRCWASCYSARVRSYAAHAGVTGAGAAAEMAVVLQTMVAADRSAVAFSVNPVTGLDTEVLIEACFGLGEALVGGQVTPDEYRFDWYHGRETGRVIREQRHEPVLSEAHVARIAAVTAEIQARSGFPVDVELALAGDELFVLQSRPITRIGFSGVDGEWTTADFKDGGVSASVCTPFMWSLYDYVWERTLPAYLEKVALHDHVHGVVWGRMFYGRPYWNVGAVKDGLARLPGYLERSFDQDLGIQPAYEGPGRQTRTTLRSMFTGLKVLTRLGRSFRAQLAYCERYAADQRERLAALDRLEVTDWPDERLFAFYRTLIDEDYLRSEGSYFNLIFDNSNATTLFREEFSKIRSPVSYVDLISGLSGLSHVRHSAALCEVVREIKASAEATRYWLEAPVADLVRDWRDGRDDCGMRATRAHVERIKHLGSRELDLSVPRFGEDPAVPFQSMQQMLATDALPDPSEASDRQAWEYGRARDQFLTAVPFYRRRGVARRLDRMRRFLWWREELRDLSTHFYFHVRRLTLEMERRLRRRGLLARQGDIFFLRWEESVALAEGRLDAAAAGRLVARSRSYYEGFRHFANPNEIGRRFGGERVPAESGSVLRGIACSAGVVTGRARVVRDIFDADRLTQGDILVTRFTDPGWTPKFSLLRAVVTETGGLLSHAAVIAREYGIPAVLAVSDATRRTGDGHQVSVDGNRGEVTLLATASP